MYNANIEIKRENIPIVCSHKRKICEAFNLKCINLRNLDDSKSSSSNANELVNIQIIFDSLKESEDYLKCKIQQYIDNLASHEGEDSSYDSEDGEIDKYQTSIDKSYSYTEQSVDGTDHEQVSRTTSDTLGQEFAEYVTSNVDENLAFFSSSAYKARVEFALKLGYTERLVQAALACLGPDPTQNELLAELIKLGAQYSGINDFSSDILSDCTSTKIGDSGNLQHNFSMVATTSEDLSTYNGLRAIVVDGSNVAMSHGNKEVFSCRGIKLCVDWFKNRGHKDITVFVPKWRKENSRLDNPILEQDILNELERERMLVFTPSRMIGGKRMICYDDRYILKLAVENDGIVVSNDNYRDLASENPDFKKVVEERVLMYSFVNDRFMPPDDPLGRSGPTLENFLRMIPKRGEAPLPCLYGKKCTYGNKCKYSHPERGLGPHKSVTERLSEHAARYSIRNSSVEIPRAPIKGKSLSVPLNTSGNSNSNPDANSFNTNDRVGRKPLCRSRSGMPEYLGQQQSIPQKQKQTALSPHSAWNTIGYHVPENTNDGNTVTFPKSRSIENISRDNTTQNYKTAWNAHNLPVQTSSVGNVQHARGQNDSVDESVNLHRKLHRQLTLNPADPRIYHLQRCMTSTGNDSLSCNNSLQPQLTPRSPHRPLVPSLSGPGKYHSNHWDLHQSVTRIASAPDGMRPNNGGLHAASASEPQINLWPQHNQSNFLAAQDQRRHLHYHLASIFPEEQVQTVLQLYPDETNPQTICAAILSMFSKTNNTQQ